MFPVLALAIATLIAATVIAGVWIRIGPHDAPDGDRKNQEKSMPTSGGIAVAATVIPATIIASLLFEGWLTPALIALIFGSALMFIMGLWDDIVDLPALPKLAAQVGLALVVAFFGVRVGQFDLGRYVFETGLIIGIFGSAAWLVVVTNAVNFMDGSDGLSMGSSATIAAGLCGLSAISGAWDIAAFSGILLAGLIGLLVFNARGKLFAGDAGSLFVGFYLAGLTLIWISRMGLSVWIAPTLFIAFLSDVLLTLIWRYQHGRNLLQPHREHIYQISIAAGVKQYVVAAIYSWICIHGILIAGVSMVFPIGGALIGFALLLLVLYIMNRRIRASAIRHGHLVIGPQ